MKADNGNVVEGAVSSAKKRIRARRKRNGISGHMKTAIVFVILAAVLSATVSCGNRFSSQAGITVITREDGSGTRSVFGEIFGITKTTEGSAQKDGTITSALTLTSTNLVLTSVADNKNAIGYVSLGMLGEGVKALSVDGVEASTENLRNGSYKAARPFNIVTKEEMSEIASDFMSFILSSQGQSTVAGAGFVECMPDAPEYRRRDDTAGGNVRISGSSSVAPVMVLLKEAYESVRSDVSVSVNINDSTTGIADCADGICDIGMASRELKASELARGLRATAFAVDGIVLIVNPDNTLDDIASSDVAEIYTGKAKIWADVEE